MTDEGTHMKRWLERRRLGKLLAEMEAENEMTWALAQWCDDGGEDEWDGSGK